VEYTSISDYLLDLQKFIDELSISGKIELSIKLSGCLQYINGSNDRWMMFYRNILSIKEEYERILSNDQNSKIDELIRAAKKVVDKL
jgi:hypothetical protein